MSFHGSEQSLPTKLESQQQEGTDVAVKQEVGTTESLADVASEDSGAKTSEEVKPEQPQQQQQQQQGKRARKRKPAADKPKENPIKEGATSAQVLAKEAGYAPQVIKKWPPDPVYSSAGMGYYAGWENEYAGTPYGNTSLFKQYTMPTPPQYTHAPAAPNNNPKTQSLREFERALAAEDAARQAEKRAAVDAYRAEVRLQALLDEIDYKVASGR